MTVTCRWSVLERRINLPGAYRCPVYPAPLNTKQFRVTKGVSRRCEAVLEDSPRLRFMPSLGPIPDP
jgi:hypothetical protein